MKWLDHKGFLRWLRYEAGFQKSARAAKRPPKTSTSATVFTGEADQWIRYVSTTREKRYRDDPRVVIDVDTGDQESGLSWAERVLGKVAAHLNSSFQCLRDKLAAKPFVSEIFDQSVFGNPSNASARPSVATERRIAERSLAGNRVEPVVCRKCGGHRASGRRWSKRLPRIFPRR